MADWSQLVKGFQGGAEFAQGYRANKQLERAREFNLARMGREEFDLDQSGLAGAQNIKDEFGMDTPLYNHEGTLQDPVGVKLVNWFKKKLGGKKKAGALDVGGGSITPTDAAAVTTPAPTAATTAPLGDAPEIEEQEFADGGRVTAEDIRRIKLMEEEAEAAMTSPKKKAIDIGEAVTRGYRGAQDSASKFMDVKPAEGAGRLARGARHLKGAGIAGALGATALETYGTPTEDYRERFGLETDDPSLAGDIGVRALGAASDLGNTLTGGLAGRLYRDKQRLASEQPAQEVAEMGPVEQPTYPQPQPGGSMRMSAMGGGGAPRRALPTAQPKQDMVDFSGLDAAPEEVPDFKTDDWKKYRVQALQHLARTGVDPTTAKQQVDKQITDIQLQGFQGYGKQGLALQMAGNNKGAMAAYRAAFQYFPNGHDVEFKQLKGKIVGFGKDEKSGKVVPGTEMVMDPERVSTLMENFANPAAFRMWTKDHRDDQFKERQYQEVTKPLAQASADAMATNSDAAVLRAENAGLKATMSGAGAGYKQADMRGDASLFRNAPQLQQLALTDPGTAQNLAGTMGRVKARYPNLTPDDIATAVMNAQSQGKLDQWLQRLGVASGAQPTPTPANTGQRSALPLQGQPGGQGGVPPGVDPNIWNEPGFQAETADWPLQDKINAATPSR